MPKEEPVPTPIPPRPKPAISPAPRSVEPPSQATNPKLAGERVSPLALRLVLGYHFERLVCEGVVKDYAEIARRTGLSRARVTQVCNLTLLAPELQEWILMPSDNDEIVESRFRVHAGESLWTRQMAVTGISIK